ncbi:MAG: cyclohexanecarboxylate-CoA ligase, partial [Verrucomicrobiaceae bacterium]
MPSPATHITGYLYGIQLPLTYGIPVVLMDQWDKDSAVEIILRWECTFTVGATPFLQELCAAACTRNISLPSLKYFLCGGAPVPPDIIYESQAVLGRCIPGRVYGCTEAPTITLGPTHIDQLRDAAETDGKPIGYDLKLIGDDGLCAKAGDGEIAVRGPEVFLGYGDPVRDAEAFDAEGFFLTGDLGHMDVDGNLTI